MEDALAGFWSGGQSEAAGQRRSEVVSRSAGRENLCLALRLLRLGHRRSAVPIQPRACRDSVATKNTTPVSSASGQTRVVILGCAGQRSSEVGSKATRCM